MRSCPAALPLAIFSWLNRDSNPRLRCSTYDAASICSAQPASAERNLLLPVACRSSGCITQELPPNHAGVAARQRKAELERLNEQLRKINMSLRQQARAGTVYAPGLNYAPIPSFAAAAPVLDDQRIQTINGVQVSLHSCTDVQSLGYVASAAHV